MGHRTKLLLLIPHLGGGGAERVTAQLARYLDPRLFDIHLCLITKDSPGAPRIPRWVQIYRLELCRVRQAGFRLLCLIRAEQPDVILSNMAHLNFLLLLLKPFLPLHTRILVRQNAVASADAESWLSRRCYKRLYPRARAILCQSEAMAADLALNFSISRDKLKVLPNPIDVHAIRAACGMPSRASDEPPYIWPNLLCVGRLAHEKGFDLLLHAMPQILDRYPRARLTILGTGPEQKSLAQLSAQLQLTTAVTLAGHSDHLAAYYSDTTFFVLPSRREGMPNALLEAAAAGLPIVATPCSPGLGDLLENASGTWLTPAISSQSLADTILAAACELAKSSRAPQRFHHAFVDPFERNTAIAAYASFIQEQAAPTCA